VNNRDAAGCRSKQEKEEIFMPCQTRHDDFSASHALRMPFAEGRMTVLSNNLLLQ
jgi:hypothetical protein